MKQGKQPRDRNKEALQRAREKHKATCAWPNCDNEPRMKCTTGAVVLKDDAEDDTKPEAYMPLFDNPEDPPEERQQQAYTLPYCMHHFAYPNESLCMVVVEDGEPQRVMVPNYQTIRLMEIVAQQVHVGHTLEKAKDEAEQADEDNTNEEAEE